MIYTGYYARLKDYINQGLTPIAISGEVPDFYDINKYLWWRKLAPSWDIFSKWKCGMLSNEGYENRYILERLEVLDKKTLKMEIDSIYKPIFLCYEKHGFCHRHILAYWLDVTFDYRVKEF